MAFFINHDCNVVEDISQASELVSQLRALLLPSLSSNPNSDIARELFEEALQFLTRAMSRLRQSNFNGSTTSSLVDLVKEEGATSKGVKTKRKSEQDNRVNKRRELQWTSETLIPYVDGHQWRKYGQKRICGEKHPRHYFRCTYLRDQGCQAKKTVQQKDCNECQPKYIVTYIKKHTCKTSETKPAVPPLAMDSSSPQSNLDYSTVVESNPMGLKDAVKAVSSMDIGVNSPFSSSNGYDLLEFPWFEMDDIEMMLGMVTTNYGSI